MKPLAKTKTSKAITLLLALLLAAAAVYSILQFRSDSTDYAVIGEQAPSFKLANLQGETVDLADYEGKGVLLNFWASWCNPCVNELPLINEAYKLSGVDVLAINVGENAETAQRFAERYELAFPIVLDEEMDIKRQYRVSGLPLTVLINSDGELVERHEGELTEMADILALLGKIGGEG